MQQISLQERVGSTAGDADQHQEDSPGGSSAEYHQERSQATGETPEYVEARLDSKKRVIFQDPITGKNITVSQDRWKPSTVVYDGRDQHYWLFKSQSLGRTFFTWTIEERHDLLPVSGRTGRHGHHKQDTEQHQATSSTSRNNAGPIHVYLYTKGDEYIRFLHSEREYKTRRERWTTKCDDDGTTYYVFESIDTGLTFYAETWPGEGEGCR